MSTTDFNLLQKIKQTCGKGEKRVAKQRVRNDTGAPALTTPDKTSAAMANLLKTLPDYSVATRKTIDSGNFETFPIAGDLPRLLKHMTLFEVQDDKYFCIFPKKELVESYITSSLASTEGKAVTAGDCLKIMQSVTSVFEAEKLDKLTSEWNGVMDNSADLSIQKTFLMQILKKVYVEDSDGESSTIMFLKAINQKIIGPSTMRIKCQCQCSGGVVIKDAQPMLWEVAVIITEDKTIISHYRRQETSSKNPNEYFRFLWELRMTFSRDLTQLEGLVMGVTEIEFNPETTDSVRDKISNALESLKLPDCFVGDIDE
ncbi:hypothetical protein EIN_184720 [Entamoeba invadens IP1]|uniref:hypothetical protein n=1 Tax=Entamoeba invadens IP1 TaxID=370355 RepID=UPI0002C3FC01|nr:hypothetical protein EIN_184720 [Entamoeba invadens IP1]ELP94105.1 hypothetical protein EIN_184720 [Entamoeba invadens IP1]|eukprot:XP_004260876.1 hypothetical protein EIN_184720 [Entamoeba invadens IP1]